MRYLLPILSFLLILGVAKAQNPNFPNENAVYDDNIRTVQLFNLGAPMEMPVVSLNARSNELVLQFDYMDTELQDYVYDIVHCDADWKQSDMQDNEYVKSFREDRITEFYTSSNTLVQYSHYILRLPNSNVRWAVSGNFLLRVYDDNDDRRLVLVRRFVVSEDRWTVDARFPQASVVAKNSTHHEIDFNVVFKNFRFSNPQREIKAYVLQNGRWDNAIGPIAPFTVQNEKIVFDYQDKVVFPGSKEWRWFDIRSFNFRGQHVRNIRELDDYNEVTLEMDKPRASSIYLLTKDFNGRFSIENANPNQDLSQCDYARVLFSIERAQPLYNQDVYIFGELSDWKIKPEFKMEHQTAVNAYVCEPLLKQGYYNYQYVVVDRETGAIDEDGLEGNSFETVNDYYILVYYRPFGDRYDHCMTVRRIESKRQ